MIHVFNFLAECWIMGQILVVNMPPTSILETHIPWVHSSTFCTGTYNTRNINLYSVPVKFCSFSTVTSLGLLEMVYLNKTSMIIFLLSSKELEPTYCNLAIPLSFFNRVLLKCKIKCSAPIDKEIWAEPSVKEQSHR